jgi:PEP-CTERM motif
MKILLAVPAFLVMLLCVPIARAGSYKVSLTILSEAGTVPNPVFPLAKFTTSGDVLSISVTPDTWESFLGGLTEAFASPSDTIYFCDGCAFPLPSVSPINPTPYAIGFFDGTGGDSYQVLSEIPVADQADTGYIYGTLTLTQTPEPGSLLLFGVGLVFAVRKRRGHNPEGFFY